MMADVSQRLEELGQASRRSAAIGGIGLCILVASLAVGAWRLRAANESLAAVNADLANKERQKVQEQDEITALTGKLAASQASLDSVAADVKNKSAELESLNQRIAEVSALVDKSPNQALARTVRSVAQLPAPAAVPSGPPLEKVAQVHLSVTPTGKVSGDKTFYAVRFWIDLPPNRVSEVAKVQYYFDNPTFVPKLWDSFDAKNGFQLKYTGWGCIDEVRVTLVGRDGSRHDIPYKMCAAWAEQGQKPVTPTW